MKVLIVLFSVFVITVGIMALAQPSINYSLAGRIAMSAMLLMTALGHFKFKAGMEMMVPEWIPAKKFVVLSTGWIEILAAAGLLIPAVINLTAWLLIVFFILILPANIYSSTRRVNFVKADLTGPGMAYLWFRIPMQLLLIAWVYYFAT